MPNLSFDVADLELDDLEVTTIREAIGRHGGDVPAAITSCCSCVTTNQPAIQPSA